jgi:hypothetical protein
VGKAFSSVQAAVGLVAGLMSIAGATYSAVQYVASPSRTGGEIVAVLRDARTDAPVGGATLEILTPQDALMATVTSSEDGSAQRALAEGAYRVRVSHASYASQARDVHVMPGETVDLRFALGPRAATRRGRGPSPLGGVARGVKQSASAAQRFFQDLTR